MALATAVLEALVAGDFRALVRLTPHLPMPPDDHAAEAQMHIARTMNDLVPERLRLWSHRWLVERGLPTFLPEDLRPKAERLEPVVVEAVLVGDHARSSLLRPVAREIQQARVVAVEEVYAEGKWRGSPPVGRVRARMNEARDRTIKKLLGV
jgi:hypothetical protein